ncbi:MAG: hypothetical protein RL748_4250 [Pseudomonadota bacterium]|jgi:hypothetical protein
MSRRTCRALPLLVLAIISPHLLAQKLATTGQFEVTPSGAAQFSVPINVPAGIAGMQPDLKLVYNSQKGSDWQAANWSVSGLSMITRCNKNMAQDGVLELPKNVGTDAFCLDGERLIPVNDKGGADGTEYRTLHDRYARITAVSSSGSAIINGVIVPRGPESFKVQTKSGQTMVYGGPVDSTATVNSPGGWRTGWALRKVSDRAGNYMLYTYRSDVDGVFQPVSIAYGGNDKVVPAVIPNVKVTFTWDLVGHSGVKYSNGDTLPRAGKITQISTQITGETSRTSYYLEDVQVSPTQKMTTVNYCLGLTDCLPPVKLNFADNPNQFKFWTSDSAFPGAQRDYQQFFADLNGDGRKYWIQISQTADDAWIGLAKPDASFTAAQWTKFTQSIGSGNNYVHTFADVNGDGKADWIRVSRATNEAWVALGTGNGNFQFWTKYLTTVGAANVNKHFFADVNGDAKVDWIQIGNANDTMLVALGNGDGTFQFWNKTITQSKLSQFGHDFADMNGDGKADWIYSYRSGIFSGNANTELFINQPNLSNGDGSFTEAKQFGEGIIPVGSKVYFADLNGDKQADVIALLPDGSSKYAISKGNGAVSDWVAAYSGDTVLLGDVSGNGLGSIVSMSSVNWSGNMLALTDGASFGGLVWNYDQSNQLGLGSGVTLSYYLTDLNGDGKADLIFVNNVTKKAMIASSQFNTNPKLMSITNDQSTPMMINYAPLWDSTVVTPDSNAVYPLRNTAYPLLGSQRAPFVVSSIAPPDGIGGWLHINYTYGGLRTDLVRRQVQGFRWMKATQQETGISTTTNYLQNWPLSGLVADSKKTITSGGNAGVLSQTSNTYTTICTTPAQTTGCTVAPGNRYATLLAQTVTSSWDLNGAVLPVLTNSYQYDAFGNPTQVINANNGGFSTTTVTTYNNDVSNWWIGRPVRTSVTKVTP